MSALLTKSAKGLAELANSVGNLDLRSRQVLILADGQCTLERMKQLRPNLDVQAIVAKLVAEGYLNGDAPAAPTAPPRPQTPPPVASAPVQETPLPPEKLAQVREIMIESTRSYVGILGSDIIRRIDAAQSLVQIKGCIAQWNMALRESRGGKQVADQHLREVHLMLEIESI